MKLELQKYRFLVIFLSILYGLSAWSLEIGLSVHNGKLAKQENGKLVMEFPVMMSATPAVPIAFTFATNDVTAKSGKEYISTKGTGIIQAKEKKTVIVIPIINEMELKGSKSFGITIASKQTPVFKMNAIGTINEQEVSAFQLTKSIIKDPS